MEQVSESQKFDYDIFISYRHLPNDTRWARWLLNALETFRVPKALIAKGYPPKVNKVFRDQDELPTSSDLSASIEKALAKSKYLVVICSPDTPKSLWVTKEIEYFHSIGRGDNIIALLIEGEPSESFPSALTLHGIKEPLAADVRLDESIATKTQKEEALFRIVACVIGCSFDELKNRGKQREFEQRKKLIIASTIVIGPVLVLSALYWNYVRVRVNLCETTTLQKHIPYCAVEISKSESKHLSDFTKIFESKGQVVKVEDFRDQRIVRTYELEYTVDGKILKKKKFDENHNLELISKFDTEDEGVVDFVDASGYPIAEVYKSDSVEATSSITRIRYQFNKNGFVEKELFYKDHWGTPTSDVNGLYGKEYVRNASGIVIEESGLGNDQSQWDIEPGISKYSYSVDSRYRRLAKRFLNQDNKLIVNKHGYAETKYDLDNWGNRISVRVLDELGKPVLGELGYSISRATLLDDGKISEIRFFSSEEMPILNNMGVHLMKMFYDNNGRENAVEGYDINLKPTSDLYGLFRYENHYDDRGNLVSNCNFAIDGKPTLNKDKIFCTLKRFDLKDRVIWQAGTDLNNKFVFNKEKYAIQTFEYNKQGKESIARFYDPNENPVCTPKFCAGYKSTYDARGNRTTLMYLAKNGERASNIDGISSYVDKYDEFGRLVSSATFGSDDKPTIDGQGKFSKTLTYDSEGQHTGYIYYDAYGSVLRSVVYTLKSGRIIKVSLFGPDGKPSPDAKYTNWTSVSYEYDSRGNQTKESYFDAQGLPTNGHIDISVKKTLYNNYSKVIEEAYFDKVGKPVAMFGAIAKKIFDYDQKQNLIKESNFGIDGALVAKPDVAITHRKYDDKNREIEFRYFDNLGNPTSVGVGVHLSRTSYDSRGNVSLETNLGTDGKEIAEYGRATVKMTYDDRGNKIEQSYYDYEDKPTHYHGLFREVFKYDPFGEKILEASFDKDGVELRSETWEFDRENFRVTNRRYKFGKPLEANPLHTFSYSILQKNKDGRPLEFRYFNHKGEPAVHSRDLLIHRAVAKDGEFGKDSYRYYGVDGTELDKEAKPLSSKKKK
ncbi:MAG: toll/interleukin-1 receptor domain-containing protein [Sphingobacteriales bacterium]|nr:MAG: toll/interleukin-1 receptor domain-containing protein [Sphingobacteriales bacterium]